eukprot:symbB.v1.2.015102.t1/scaffold1086.1/size139141/3
MPELKITVPQRHEGLQDFGLWLFLEARQAESSKGLDAGYVVADCCLTVDMPSATSRTSDAVCAGSMAPLRPLPTTAVPVLERGSRLPIPKELYFLLTQACVLVFQEPLWTMTVAALISLSRGSPRYQL